jgi:hypothetical protein
MMMAMTAKMIRQTTPNQYSIQLHIGRRSLAASPYPDHMILAARCNAAALFAAS